MGKQFEVIHSLKEIQKYISNPKDTLIVFDVDYVLTHPNDPAYQFPNFSKHLEFVKKTFSELNATQKDLFANLMVFDVGGSSLVEESAASVLNSLQKNGYKTVALTAALTCTLAGQDVKEKRANHLKTLGIDFSNSFTDFKSKEFKSCDSNMGSYPELYRGILFSNGENLKIQKGQVLKEFLKYVNYRPKTIVVIDDRQNNLDSIADEFNDTETMIKGLLYKGSLEFESKEISTEDFKLKWKNLSDRAIALSESYSEQQKQNGLI